MKAKQKNAMQLLPATKQEVRRIRRTLKASPQVFAQIMGVSVPVVKAWETGELTPSGGGVRKSV